VGRQFRDRQHLALVVDRALSERALRRVAPFFLLCALVPASVLAGTGRGVFFENAAADSGIVWRNLSGGKPDKWTILETTGAGACLFDADGDGDLDLYLVNGGTLAGLSGQAGQPAASDAFYLNDGRGNFEDVTAAAGFGTAEKAWGGGCAAADPDNDGDADILVTNFGPSVFYRNDGRGHFSDATATVGLVGGPESGSRWSLGAVFFDSDGDGDLDLYVANYLIFDPADGEMLARRCRWKSGEVMCGPRGFAGQPDNFYRNRGDGTFEEVSADAGVKDAYYGMGVVAGDLDGDGDTDLFVANDSQQNLLLVGDGKGAFRDAALEAGVALSGDGRPQSGMGTDLGDYDGDGDEDLLVTNFSDDYHTLYRNDGDLLFTDVSGAVGLDPATRFAVGWAAAFFDFDNDGDLDIFTASGHVYPGVENFDAGTSYRQRNQLFENDGHGAFREVGAEGGEALTVPGNGRGVATGDIDDDGDLDLVVVNSDGPPVLLKNQGGNKLAWVELKLQGTKSPRDGIGTQVSLHAGGKRQFREARRNAGYLSSHDPRLHFGLGEAKSVDKIELRWPSGKRQTLENLPARCILTIDEDRGLVAKDCGKEKRGPLPPAPLSADGEGGDPNREGVPPSSSPPLAEGAKLSPRGEPEGRSPSEELIGSPPFPSAERGAGGRGPAPAPASKASNQEGEPEGRSPSEVLIGSPPFPSAERGAGGRGPTLPSPDRQTALRAAQAATLEVLAGRYRKAILGFEQLLGRLPPWEAAKASPDAFGFGKPEAYRAFLAAIHDNMGVALLRAERFEDGAAAVTRAIELEPLNSKYHHNLGVCLFHARHYPEAIAALRRGLELGEPDIRYDLGRALAAGGSCVEADAVLSGALAEAELPDPRGRAAEILYLRGGCRADTSRLAEAEDDFRASLERLPGHQKSLFKLSGLLARRGDERLAAAARELFLARQSADDQAQRLKVAGIRSRDELLRLIESYLEAALPNQALDEIETLLAIDPRDPAGLILEGEARLALAPPAAEKAAESFRRALALDPSQPRARLGLALAEARRQLAAGGDVLPAAVAALRRQLAERPGHPETIATLAEALVAGPEARKSAAEALALAGALDERYGRGDRARLAALGLLGKSREAADLRRDSFFLGPKK
jgi:tetratricopeptide (TPR) repeat protein